MARADKVAAVAERHDVEGLLDAVRSL